MPSTIPAIGRSSYVYHTFLRATKTRCPSLRSDALVMAVWRNMRVSTWLWNTLHTSSMYILYVFVHLQVQCVTDTTQTLLLLQTIVIMLENVHILLLKTFAFVSCLKLCHVAAAFMSIAFASGKSQSYGHCPRIWPLLFQTLNTIEPSHETISLNLTDFSKTHHGVHLENWTWSKSR